MRRYIVLFSLLFVLSLNAAATFAQDTQPDLHEFVYNGQTRTYLLHLPPQYDGTTPLPLVFVFHGGGGNARISEQMTQFYPAADEMGFIVVHPNGSGNRDNILLTWNGGFCCDYARDYEIDDVGFISALIDELAATYAVDVNRIYATGFSNGAIMSHRLGAELSDKIAAIAPVAGAIGGNAHPGTPLFMPSSPDNPVSVLIIHGFMDLNMPYNGGNSSAGLGVEDFWAVSVGESTRFWVEANNCDYLLNREVDSSGLVFYDSYECPSGVDVEVVTIVDAGHSWPGGNAPRPGANEPSSRLDATRYMLEFFATHPRNQ